ncbi:MAG: hypothetical protein LUG44_07950 [Clostridiales bacterium]|nr:hypothetical protein [Clostridiales bacterium]
MSVCTFLAANVLLPEVLPKGDEDRPVFRRAAVTIDDLLPEHLRELDDKEVLDGAGRSTAYCLSIKRKPDTDR